MPVPGGARPRPRPRPAARPAAGGARPRPRPRPTAGGAKPKPKWKFKPRPRRRRKGSQPGRVISSTTKKCGILGCRIVSSSSGKGKKKKGLKSRRR